MSKSMLKIQMLFLIVASMGMYLAAQDITEKKPINQTPTRYQQNVFENIAIQKNVVFGESVTSKGEQINLLLDIYTPENDNVKNRPVIVWMHGGGFRYGNDKTQSYIVELATRFARKGYVCISIDYRLRENPMDDISGTISDAVKDATKALEWVGENSGTLGIDPSKIIIAGGSAGGILGSKICFNDRNDKNDNEDIIGFVNMWGAPSVKWMSLDIDPNDPPTIMVHGTEDKLVSYSNAVEFTERLKANKIKHELVTIEGAGHTPVKHMDEFEVKIAEFLYDILN